MSTRSGPAQPVPAPAPSGPAFGLTEDNADLLWNPAHDAPSGGAAFAPAREQLTALHPTYLRLLVDWAALQPDPHMPPALEGPIDGCARGVGPCGEFGGLGEEFAAAASQQHAARAEGRADFQVVLDIFGAPQWAARAPSRCEVPGARSFSRPVDATGLAGYRALIGALLALGAREGVQLTWWSPWNEPNNTQFVSPQRDTCGLGAPPATAVYAQLASAMAEELGAAGGTHRLLLGELASARRDSVQRTSIASFVAALPASVLCLGETWSLHSYARYQTSSAPLESVAALERALDARGKCGRAASIWVTESGVGAPHPGRPRTSQPAERREGCLALARQLISWSHDQRVGAVFQYTFREDPSFPVGLLSADLAHAYPAYSLWLAYAHARARGQSPTSPQTLCA